MRGGPRGLDDEDEGVVDGRGANNVERGRAVGDTWLAIRC